jgi:host factor-I protein
VVREEVQRYIWADTTNPAVAASFRKVAPDILDPERDNMEKPTQNIQDGFLNSARKEKIIVTIYLVSGVKLMGRIRSFDKYSVVLDSNGQEQLIFKHAISTVVLPRPGMPAAHSTAPEG